MKNPLNPHINTMNTIRLKTGFCALLCALMLTNMTSCVKTDNSNHKVNDSNTPLHLMQPEYKTPYGVVDSASVKASIDRVLAFLENATPTKVIDKETKNEITDYSKIDKNSELEIGRAHV